MKIALCATELETDAVSAFLNIASYLHMVEKKSDAAMVLFPLRRFQEKDWKESLILYICLGANRINRSIDNSLHKQDILRQICFYIQIQLKNQYLKGTCW